VFVSFFFPVGLIPKLSKKCLGFSKMDKKMSKIEKRGKTFGKPLFVTEMKN